jgi:hypothetical protein
MALWRDINIACATPPMFIAAPRHCSAAYLCGSLCAGGYENSGLPARQTRLLAAMAWRVLRQSCPRARSVVAAVHEYGIDAK